MKNKQLEDLQLLIRNMKYEIDILRNIIYRYHLKYGNEVKSGVIIVPENMYFLLDYRNEKGYCDKKTKIKKRTKSNYYIISEMLKKLNNRIIYL